MQINRLSNNSSQLAVISIMRNCIPHDKFTTVTGMRQLQAQRQNMANKTKKTGVNILPVSNGSNSKTWINTTANYIKKKL